MIRVEILFASTQSTIPCSLANKEHNKINGRSETKSGGSMHSRPSHRSSSSSHENFIHCKSFGRDGRMFIVPFNLIVACCYLRRPCWKSENKLPKKEERKKSWRMKNCELSQFGNRTIYVHDGSYYMERLHACAVDGASWWRKGWNWKRRAEKYLGKVLQ